MIKNIILTLVLQKLSPTVLQIKTMEILKYDTGIHGILILP